MGGRTKLRKYTLAFAMLLAGTLFGIGDALRARAASELKLQPITTAVVCATPETCMAAGLPNVYRATLRRPATDVLGHAHIAIEATHDSASSINADACAGFAQRGYTILCADGPFSSQFAYYGLEQIVPTIASAIKYLRSPSRVSNPAIDKVVIFGHSGGGSLQPFYENVAENGPAVCQNSEKLVPCIDTNLHNLPKADGVILFDAHPGLGLGAFTYLDPAIMENYTPPGNVPANRDLSLDMFSTANGYDPATKGGTYSQEFVANFLMAQAQRNKTLLQAALGLLRMERLYTGNPNAMGDDIPFTVVGGFAARLWQADTGGTHQSTSGLVNCTERPHMLLSHDGTRPVKVVCSARVPSGNADLGLSDKSTLHLTVHSYLGVNSIRTKGHYSQSLDDITGFDYESSNTSTAVNIRGIGKNPNPGNATTPLLIVANGAHYFLRPDEFIYDNATTPDKTYVIEEGAVHVGTECAACEALLGLPQPSGPGTFGYFGDTFTRTLDFMAEWLNARYR
jgi:hypothetical protein